MNSHLLAAVICAGVSLFNLYYYIQRETTIYLILFAIWAITALKNFWKYRSK